MMTEKEKKLVEQERKAREKLAFRKYWFAKNQRAIYNYRDRRRAQLKLRRHKIHYGSIYLPILRGQKII